MKHAVFDSPTLCPIPSPPQQYEFHMVHELIKQGHPEAARKVGLAWQAAPLACHRAARLGATLQACLPASCWIGL